MLSLKLHDHSMLLSSGANVSFVGGNTLKIAAIQVKGVEPLMSYRVEFENDLALQKALAVGVHRILMDKVNAMDKTKPADMQESLMRHGKALGSGQSSAGRTSDPLVQEMKRIAMDAAKKHKAKTRDDRKLPEIRDEILTKHAKKIQARAQENLDARDMDDFEL